MPSGSRNALFGEPGRNVIDLIESQFRHLMRVATSVREGSISSTLLLRRLRAGSRMNDTRTAFREVGRVIRTVQLLRYFSDAPRAATTAPSSWTLKPAARCPASRAGRGPVAPLAQPQRGRRAEHPSAPPMSARPGLRDA
ncbi:Tn3 family transposase [Streptomyces pratensis]|uniref:Tn3 family transposase n=1 Tax=Streptomyces pratensis TaxID=1169025 RepID=UPI00362F5264